MKFHPVDDAGRAAVAEAVRVAPTRPGDGLGGVLLRLGAPPTTYVGVRVGGEYVRLCVTFESGIEMFTDAGHLSCALVLIAARAGSDQAVQALAARLLALDLGADVEPGPYGILPWMGPT